MIHPNFGSTDQQTEINESASNPVRHFYEAAYPRARVDSLQEIDEAAAAGASLEEKRADVQDIIAANLREEVRTIFAFGILLIFGIVIAFALWASTTSIWANAKDALLIVLPAITGVLGFAVGFYYLTILGAARTT